jgi:hypothetical protein
MVFIFFAINSTVEIARDVFRILADYRLRHLVNNVTINTHDYIRMEITVLYLKISWTWNYWNIVEMRIKHLITESYISIICDHIISYYIWVVSYDESYFPFNFIVNCIVFENFMASIVDLMVSDICLLAPLTRHQ